MSISERDSAILKTMLINTNEDFLDFVPNFMYFFTPDELRFTIKSFNDNLEIITNELLNMRDAITNDLEQNLKNHGLLNLELKRKYEMYDIVRNDYHSKKLTFVKSFIKLGKTLKKSERNVIKAKDLSTYTKKIYETARNKLKKLNISKERFFEFLNSILKSIADALGIGGIVSEYKDSIEIATKKENTIQFHEVVFEYGYDLFEKMEEYNKNQPSTSSMVVR